MQKAEKDEISSRIQVVCSDLMEFRKDFIRGAIVFGSCRAKNISDEFKPKDKVLPDNNIEYRLRIFFDPNQHKFHLWNDEETYDWLINNTGPEDYTNMLCDIWPDGDYSWLIEKPDHIELLNKKADITCELSKPLLKIREYRSVVAKVRAIVRYNGDRWTDKSNVDWSYPEKIESIVKELESAVAQKPEETERNTTAAKIINIENSNVIMGNIQQPGNLQVGDYASIHKYPKIKKKGILKRIPRWIYYVLGTLAALVTVLHLLGLLEPIKRLFTR
jgi:hypothetical protein